MKLLEFALFSAAAPSSFAADVGHFEGAGDRASSRAAAGRRGDDTGAVVGGVRGGHARPVSLGDEASGNMCDACYWHSDCASGYCSWKNWVCYDSEEEKGENGCACLADTDCISGRCAGDFQCADKAENGGGCINHDDCVENYCGWDLFCHPGCTDKREIPFMVTNTKLTQEGGMHYWGHGSHESEDEFKYLKNIKYCPDAGRIYGQLISKEQFKEDVDQFVTSESDYDHVFYNIHGFNVGPEGSFGGKSIFDGNGGEDSGYLMIPINWRNYWEFGPVSYENDRTSNAIDAGKALATQIDMFQLTAKTSIMCHSMGNWVFQVMAQEVANPEQVFENVFMVAADARMDMFAPWFNPDAPGASGSTDNGISTDALDAHASHVDASLITQIPAIPAALNLLCLEDNGGVLKSSAARGRRAEEVALRDEETRQNGGLAIARLTKHTHVVWNREDKALCAREYFQLGYYGTQEYGEYIMRALGKYGDQNATTQHYFKERVTYHDMTSDLTRAELDGVDPVLEHSYQFMSLLVNLYTQYKSSVTDNMLSKLSTKVE